jgi:hypothetical protein
MKRPIAAAAAAVALAAATVLAAGCGRNGSSS